MARPVIIYIPGLGDRTAWVVWPQILALQRWRRNGFRIKPIRIGWSEEAPLNPRYKQLIQTIRAYHEAGHRVSIVGTSAGASIAVRALAENPDLIHRVITICGKLDGSLPKPVSATNPTFAESYQRFTAVKSELQARITDRVMCFYSPADIVVPVGQSVLRHTQAQATPKLGHNLACLFVLVFRTRQATQFLRSDEPETS